MVAGTPPARSLRTRLLAISAVTIVLSLFAAALAFEHLFARNLERRLDAEMAAYGEQLAAGLAFASDGALRAPAPLSDRRFEESASGLYWQIDEPVGASLRSRSLGELVLALPRDLHAHDEIHRYRLPGPRDGTLLVQEQVLTASTPAGARPVRIAVALDLAVVEEATAVFVRDLVPYLVVLGLVLAASSIVQLTLGLRPLDRIAIRLDDIRERRAPRLAGRFPVEIQRLVDAVNDLLDARESAVDEARTRAANLAHGLKTPLTVLRNDARSLRLQGDTAMASELDTLAEQMGRRVEHELALSRIAGGRAGVQEPAALDSVCADIVRALQRTPDGERLAWRIGVPPGHRVAIGADDLRELLGNLVENACRHARHTVAVSARHAGPLVELRVEDDGPGVAEADLGRLTMRGLRLDESLGGSGIGLDIVREIARVHDVGLRFANRAEGGLRVTLTLASAGDPGARAERHRASGAHGSAMRT